MNTVGNINYGTVLPNTVSTGTITIPAAGLSAAGAYSFAVPAYTMNYAANQIGIVSNSGLKVTGSSTFDGDVTIQGRSISKTLETIEKRLAILTPDPKKLEKWEVLQKAYSQYKMLEALLHEEDNGNA
jgi:hypothetical protein